MIAKPNPLSRSISSTYHLATIRTSNKSKGSSSSALATINNNNQDLIIISALVTKGRQVLTTKSSTPYDELAKTYRPTDRPLLLSCNHYNMNTIGWNTYIYLPYISHPQTTITKYSLSIRYVPYTQQPNQTKHKSKSMTNSYHSNPNLSNPNP